MNAFWTTNFNLLKSGAAAAYVRLKIAMMMRKLIHFSSRNYSRFPTCFIWASSLPPVGRKSSSSKWKFNDVQIGFMLISAWVTIGTLIFGETMIPGDNLKNGPTSTAMKKKGSKNNAIPSTPGPLSCISKCVELPLHICLLFKHKMTLR